MDLYFNKQIMEVTVKELRELIEGLPEEMVVCVGEEGDYISIETCEVRTDDYTNYNGIEKEGDLLILKNA